MHEKKKSEEEIKAIFLHKAISFYNTRELFNLQFFESVYKLKRMDKETRWKQRFQNFEKAFRLLEVSKKIAQPSDTERAGLIQFFEITFELAWKTLKDYLESQGFQVNSPRETLKQAFQVNLLLDGHTWMEILDNRNLTTHTYDEAISLQVERLIKEKYFSLLKQLYETLKTKSS